MVINPIVVVYIPIIRIPIEGGMTIPNIVTFDHGTHMFTCEKGKSSTPKVPEIWEEISDRSQEGFSSCTWVIDWNYVVQNVKKKTLDAYGWCDFWTSNEDKSAF